MVQPAGRSFASAPDQREGREQASTRGRVHLSLVSVLSLHQSSIRFTSSPLRALYILTVWSTASHHIHARFFPMA